MEKLMTLTQIMIVVTVKSLESRSQDDTLDLRGRTG